MPLDPALRDKILAAVESASGVVNAVPIATASPRMMGIALAAYDYVMDMHTRGEEIKWINLSIVNIV